MSSSPFQTDVLIAGAGPAGLMLAVELRLAGVDVIIVERHPERPGYCRGFNLNARSLDLLARRGLADALIAEGRRVPNAAVGGIDTMLLLAGTTTDHPFTLGIPQSRVEEYLEEHAAGLGAEILRGHELRVFTQDGTGVTATVHTGHGEREIRAGFLVGCDGSRSVVRKQAGIAFLGTAATTYALLGDVEIDLDDLPLGATHGPDGGSVFVIPRPGYVRIVTRDENPPEDKDTPVTLEVLQAQVDAAIGRHVELRAPRWMTRFGDAARLAARYREGRVLLAGDAAHIHPPSGAIGVNVALDDAVNLGWKLAATVRGTAPAHLLDTYHTERHAAGERILANTRAQMLLGELSETDDPVKNLLSRIARHPAGNRAFTEVIVGLDARYETVVSGDHPWLGRLAPDVPLTTSTGETRLTALLHPARPVLLDLTPDHAFAAYSSTVDTYAARCPAEPDLRAALLRPDGHTAWLSTTPTTDPTLPLALTTWAPA
ncbi:FAD-dependent monooxygenase [Amycolatopsis sp. NPDC059027]|uniref:FAD-dependent monooxygenase n=1 Tax=Amycolatopsis sp. NPDC059027 TaxID=3346709 RepID=UPI0036716675